MLLDLVMPGMDGREVLERLLRMDPEAKVVICTGYGASEPVDDLLAAGALASIAKPFTLADLRDLVER